MDAWRWHDDERNAVSGEQQSTGNGKFSAVAMVPTPSRYARADGRVAARKRPRWPYWIAVAAIALVGAALTWRHHTGATAAAIIDPAGIVAVTKGDVEKSVESAGTVVANLEVDIKCRASGAVTKLPFDISQKVKAGELLCQIDPTDEQLAVRLQEAAVAQSTAKLAQAKDNLEQAEQNLVTTRRKDESALTSAKVKAANLRAKAERQKQLIAQHLGSREDYETAQTEAASAEADQRSAEIAIDELRQQEIQIEYKKQDIKTAEAQLQSEQVNLDTQQQQLSYTTVTAPIDGTVAALDVQLGSMVASGTLGFSGGTTIMTLSDLSRMFVTATVDQSDMGGVRVGQEARIAVDSYPERSFRGRIVRLAVKGTSSSNIVTFEVRIEVLDERRDLLKPQMTGNVTIVEDTRRNVLTVPTSAIIHENGRTFLKLASGGQRAVMTGLEGSETVEVITGVSEGDHVVLGSVELPTKWKSRDEGGPPQP